MANRWTHRIIAAAGGIIAVLGGGSSGQTQTGQLPAAPYRPVIDAFGVNTTSAGLLLMDSPLTIGAGDEELQHVRTWLGQYSGHKGWTHSYKGVLSISGDGEDSEGNTIYTAKIQIGPNLISMKSERYSENDQVKYKFSDPERLGGNLYLSDPTNIMSNDYTYISRDGTSYTFNRYITRDNASYGGGGFAPLVKITKPSGLEVMLSYKRDSYSQYYCEDDGEGNQVCGMHLQYYMVRLTSVSNSAGYRLLFKYATSNTSTPDEWNKISAVQALNDSSNKCTSEIDCSSAAYGEISYNFILGGGELVFTALHDIDWTERNKA